MKKEDLEKLIDEINIENKKILERVSKKQEFITLYKENKIKLAGDVAFELGLKNIAIPLYEESFKNNLTNSTPLSTSIVKQIGFTKEMLNYYKSTINNDLQNIEYYGGLDEKYAYCEIYIIRSLGVDEEITSMIEGTISQLVYDKKFFGAGELQEVLDEAPYLMEKE